MAPRCQDEQVRAADLAAALSLAIDYGMGSPLEQGLHAALVGTRLAHALGLDPETVRSTYYTCLLLHLTCTTDAHVSAAAMAPGAAGRHLDPVIFGSPAEQLRGAVRALGEGSPSKAVTVPHVVAGLMAWGRRRTDHFRALCEVGPMLSVRLGLPSAVAGSLAMVTERWDGRGLPERRSGSDLPLPVRIAQLARDACLQSTIQTPADVEDVVSRRAGHAFDPSVADTFRSDPEGFLDRGPGVSLWDEALAAEPGPPLTLRGAQIDEALSAFGDFADLASPCLSGHSAGVAELAARAAERAGCAEEEVTRVRRAGWVHDIGGVAVWTEIWSKPEPLTPDEQEQVRLHPYHTQRILVPSSFTAALDPIASHHHEAMDGSGYHRGESGAAIPPLARMLAAADAFRVLIEPRRGRAPATRGAAASRLREEVAAGRLDAECVAAVLSAAGEHVGALERPVGLTEREVQVVARLARGLATKQIARDLGISFKTADRHVQNAYAKMGVSTRPAATLFAMRHGLTAWGERPIPD
jgi:HD-GYP domain-containing protein (c-di-GMP phosphodiesterase class II)